MRKSVDLLLFASLDSNAILVLQSKSNIYVQCYIKHAVNCLFSTFGASKHLCLLFCLLSQVQKNAPFDAVLNHVARHELDATLKVFGKLLLRPVQVPDESLKGVQLPEEVLWCPRAIAANDPNTHTHAHTQVRGARSPGWREEGQSVGGKGEGCCGRCRGGCSSSAPEHSSFFSDHILTGPWVSVSVCSVSVWVEGASRVYCHKSITMLQSMVIDWDVKWPHADKVTAETAANHTVSRQRTREWRSEGGRVKIAFMAQVCFYRNKGLPIDFLSSQALTHHPCPQAAGAPGRITIQTMQTFLGILSRANWESARGKTWS